MLSPADRALADRDAALPGLALLLDPQALRDLLVTRYPALAGHRLDPTYLRYKPGTSCLAGFRIDGAATPSWVNVSARTRDADSKIGKFLERPALIGSLGPSRAYWPDQALTVSLYPDDRRLKALRRTARPGSWARLLHDLALPRDADITVLRYRPERRLVARIDQAGRAIAVLKLHSADAFPAARANAVRFSGGDGLVVAPALAASERFDAVASAWIDGDPVRPDANGLWRIGRALCALHRQDPAGLAPLTTQRQQGDAEDMAAAIAALCPELAEPARALSARIAGFLRPGPDVALHGDCHLGQILDQGDRIGLVDFDEVVRGPAAWDLGNLIAHAAIEQAGSDLPRLAESLTDGYRASGGAIDKGNLAAQTALALLRLATRPFRERHADWPDVVAAILVQANAALPGPTALPVSASHPCDAALPLMAAALDPATAHAALLAANMPLTVERAALVRHKPGKRCLIAYDLQDSDGTAIKALGKQRAKGADTRAFALQCELWNGGFAPGGHAAARVAEPIALIPRLGMWLQAAVPAAPFTPQTCPPDRAAQAIGALHTARIRPLKIHRLVDEMAILSTRLADLAERRGDWATRLARLLDGAHVAARGLDSVALRPVHRDFYFDHILLADSGPHLIDLDLVSLGDPALDIGNFTAHLIERSLRETGNPSLLAGWQARFVAAACRGSSGVRANNVRVYELLSLMRLVEIADRMPERRSSAESLLHLCEGMAAAFPVPIRRTR